jgi:hypothetical protein
MQTASPNGTYSAPIGRVMSTSQPKRADEPGPCSIVREAGEAFVDETVARGGKLVNARRFVGA